MNTEKLKLAVVQGAACGFMVGAVLLVGRSWTPAALAAQAPPLAVPATIAAHQFQVIDDAGKIRADLYAARDGGSPVFLLYDGKENLRTMLALDPSGSPSLELFDKTGKVIRRFP